MIATPAIAPITIPAIVPSSKLPPPVEPVAGAALDVLVLVLVLEGRSTVSPEGNTNPATERVCVAQPESLPFWTWYTPPIPP